jgi:hypothetical protein
MAAVATGAAGDVVGDIEGGVVQATITFKATKLNRDMTGRLSASKQLSLSLLSLVALIRIAMKSYFVISRK